MPSLYLHIPFCVSKCAYCDFASYPHREVLWDRYAEALIDEIASYSIKDFSTVFVGGGTPTILPDALLERILRAVPLAAGAEFTVEANPGTLTPEKLSMLRACGVNRLSIGAQSFDNSLLRMLGRIHDAQAIAESVRMARAAGFENINLDLMYALPFQTAAQWADTLERAVSLGVEHISAYSLIVEAGTPMAARVASGAAVLPEDEAVNAMQRYAGRFLMQAGYGRYEISNYARAGYECAHNRVYWQRGEYIGCGCAAHSLWRNQRYANPASLEDYLAGVRKIDLQPLTEEDLYEETILLGTRMREGIPQSALRDIAKARPLVQAGFAVLRDGRFMLTERGMEVQNAIVLELLS